MKMNCLCQETSNYNKKKIYMKYTGQKFNLIYNRTLYMYIYIYRYIYIHIYVYDTGNTNHCASFV